jgi:hypothetical protein
MAKSGLFEVERLERWRGSRALVPVDMSACPACGSELHRQEFVQAPLLRHGGYGAATETRSVSCSRCTWHLTNAVSEIRP